MYDITDIVNIYDIIGNTQMYDITDIVNTYLTSSVKHISLIL